MFVVITIHYAKPQYVENFPTFMARVETAAEGSPGPIEFRSWREVGSNRLLGLSRWESKEAFEASLPRIMSLSEVPTGRNGLTTGRHGLTTCYA